MRNVINHAPTKLIFRKNSTYFLHFLRLYLLYATLGQGLSVFLSVYIMLFVSLCEIVCAAEILFCAHIYIIMVYII